MSESTPLPSISLEQKRADIAAFIAYNDILQIDEACTSEEREQLQAWFLDALVSLIDENTPRRAPAKAYLLGKIPVMLHAHSEAGNRKLVDIREDASPLLHLYRDSPDSVKQQLGNAQQAAKDQEPIEDERSEAHFKEKPLLRGRSNMVPLTVRDMIQWLTFYQINPSNTARATSCPTGKGAPV